MADQDDHERNINATETSLDSSLKQGKNVLTKLEKALRSLPQNKVLTPWLRQIQGLIDTPPTQVVIGVVGATGSGKSSIINALLGETQLIPTNCMRACTAVVTEISFNCRTDGHPWRAEIEFISQEEWRKELNVLLGDVRTALNSIKDDDSEAGIAFAKITAVYSAINAKNISNTNVDELMQKEEVLGCLGSKPKLEAETSEKLHEKLKIYIDSKEKLSPNDASTGLQAPADADLIGYWPLIKRVSIFGRGTVLETGCVLVDLPGIADSNPARAAVAQNYLKNCAALWIVAPIIRAPDEKSARYLLGEGFRRQLHRDGTINRITFICSKTDEIVIREARSYLDSDPAFAEGILSVDNLRAQVHKEHTDAIQNLSQVREVFENVTELHSKLYKEEQAYRSLRKLAAAGQVVHPPLLTASLSKKRSAVDTKDPQTPKKKSKLDQFMDRASQSPSGSSTSPSKTDKGVASSHPLSPKPVVQDKTKSPLPLKDIESKLRELTQERPKVRADIDNAKEKKREHNKKLEHLKHVERELSEKEWVMCVLGRNRYSTVAIKADFAAGLHDLAHKGVEGDEYIKTVEDSEDDNEIEVNQNSEPDEETEADEDDESDEDFEADEDAEISEDSEVHRDNDGNEEAEADEEVVRLAYDLKESAGDEVAVDLPVFCVSAQGYHKMHGQLKGERSAACFSDETDTGIPALQNHAIKLGTDQMLADEEAFVNEACRLLTSFRLWCSGTGENKPLELEGGNTDSVENVVNEVVKVCFMFAPTVYQFNNCRNSRCFPM